MYLSLLDYILQYFIIDVQRINSLLSPFLIRKFLVLNVILYAKYVKLIMEIGKGVWVIHN